MNTKKMQVLYVEQTGHILAAFTRSAAPEAKFDVKALAGTDLLLRNSGTILPTPASGGESFSVPIELLKSDIVEFNENAMVMPWNFSVGGGQANDLTNAALPGAPYLTKTKITIKVNNPVPQDTNVWAQIQQKDPVDDNPVRMIVSGAILKENLSVNPPLDGKKIVLPLTPTPGDEPASISPVDYYVLVLVAGSPPLFSTITAT